MEIGKKLKSARNQKGLTQEAQEENILLSICPKKLSTKSKAEKNGPVQGFCFWHQALSAL